MANDGESLFFTLQELWTSFLQCRSRVASTLYHGTMVRVSMSVWRHHNFFKPEGMLFLIDSV
jgi:hypothetical protein